MLGLSNKINAEDILTTIDDGRLVILHDDGTWEFSQSHDDGKIAISVIEVIPVEDKDGYEACKVIIQATNRTEFEFKHLYLVAEISTSSGSRRGARSVLYRLGITGPGDTWETEEKDLINRDVICEDIDSFAIGSSFDKRSVKGKRFDSDKDAKKFFTDLLVVSSSYNNQYGKIRISGL